MRLIVAIMGLALLAGCVVPSQPVSLPPQTTAQTEPSARAKQNFLMAVNAMEPVAEQYCRALTQYQNCDFQIAIDDRPSQSPNAFQTLDTQGRPVLAFNLALIANAENVDELAFVMGHEAAHHIMGHIPQQQQSASQGAMLAGLLIAVSGGDEAAILKAQQFGASVGARRFSKGFELEADALGAELTERAGFDALRGAAYFDRLPDPGDQFLGSHPPNSARRATVQKVVNGLR
ncbi:peptidase M48 [Pseudorhodobacter turbinis]|uniref:Peptidase M48 n=1 Tax=Pseudorhodobacter turbinis TaxID=2500533 RepID=A0A4P8EI81_9RHOB|nr:M48 family metallopeptidase [Pseudorhodobacter turbinis]QCO56335.1 peptidase M48 [Pseudorhodobacter turbinis]